jgi:ATP-dependent DNA ligase
MPSLFDDLNKTTTTEATAPPLPLLYNIDTKGKLRSLQITVEPRTAGFAVVVSAGLVDGAKVTNEHTVTSGKNIGRANETTAFEQAVFEAKAKWDSKVRSGYCERAEDCKQDTLGSGIPAPMLAQKYSPDGSQSGSKPLAKMKLEGERIHVQPKFDGNRCLIKVNAETVELYTRKGDRMLPVPHIEEQIRVAYDALKVDREYILDGELYTDAFSFNTLNGLIRREDKTPEHLEQLKLVNYHLYDLMSEKSDYSIRYELIETYFANDRNIKLVPSFEIEATDAAIREKMEQFLNEGYEGLMIRRLDMPYENKRSWSLCKYKDFMDAEYKCVDIVEDVRGTGIVGAFVLELAAPSIDRDGREIKTFNAGIKDLSHDESRKMLENKADFIGRFATVEFFSLSEYGIPRFPKLKGFRADV